MKTTEEKIRAIARKMGISYIYDDWTKANVRIERTPLPVMVNVLPVSGSIRKANMGQNYVLQSNCLIAFLDKTDFDFDSTENDAIVHRMTDYAIAFVMLLDESGEFEPLGTESVRMQICYDKMDCNVTGVVLELTLTDAQGYCINNPMAIIEKYGNGHGGN